MELQAFEKYFKLPLYVVPDSGLFIFSQPNEKEDVVVKRSTLSKGQRLLKREIKTSWWLSELQKRYTPEECKLLE